MESRIEELERQLKETSDRLSSTREQLRLQSRRARQLVAACTAKVEEKEREMRMLRVLKDGQLQSIVRQLLHFESRLRQEQQRVVEIVRQKDQVIHSQSVELDQLRQANRKLLMAAHQDAAVSDEDRSTSPSSANPASKMPKLDQCEDKENVVQLGGETPLVTKMVRRFEMPPPPAGGQKPEVPKKPTRLLTSQPQPQPPTTTTPNNAIATASSTTDSTTKGVVRTDSVNDHGYFTLEKRKPVRMSVASPTPDQVPSPAPIDPLSQKDLVTDETDLRQNFEEFHLMDSLEEEEQQQLQFQPRTPDRSSGDGAERSSTTMMTTTTLMQTPPPAERSTSLNLSTGSGVQILPQIGDATPTSGVQFDRFLDVTGLTQKSILTPSRLLSNHKNMLKPKDIKHRHMINKASSSLQHHSALNINCRSSSSDHPAANLHHHHSTNHVRYYVEPFL